MIQVNNLSFSYTESTFLKQLNFNISKGKVLAIVGESGSGKSTLLQLLGGLLQPKEGELFFNGNKLLGPEDVLVAGHDDIKYVAQEFNLVNYTTVSENIGMYVSNQNLKKKQIRVNAIIEALLLNDVKDLKVKFISGGQKQRTTLGKAIANTPKLLILDEPFSHLDNMLKIKVRDRLFDLFHYLGMTIIFSTHDMQDALSYADTIIVLKNGAIIQNGSPLELYKSPNSKYVAELIGYVNELEDNELFKLFKNTDLKANHWYYPEDLKKENMIKSYTIIRTLFLGATTFYKVKLNNFEKTLIVS